MQQPLHLFLRYIRGYESDSPVATLIKPFALISPSISNSEIRLEMRALLNGVRKRPVHVLPIRLQRLRDG